LQASKAGSSEIASINDIYPMPGQMDGQQEGELRVAPLEVEFGLLRSLFMRIGAQSW
jgi:hypothetical protein